LDLIVRLKISIDQEQWATGYLICVIGLIRGGIEGTETAKLINLTGLGFHGVKYGKQAPKFV